MARGQQQEAEEEDAGVEEERHLAADGVAEEPREHGRDQVTQHPAARDPAALLLCGVSISIIIKIIIITTIIKIITIIITIIKIIIITTIIKIIIIIKIITIIITITTIIKIIITKIITIIITIIINRIKIMTIIITIIKIIIITCVMWKSSKRMKGPKLIVFSVREEQLSPRWQWLWLS